MIKLINIFMNKLIISILNQIYNKIYLLVKSLNNNTILPIIPNIIIIA